MFISSTVIYFDYDIIVIFFERVSYSLGWSKTQYEAEDGLELVILLPVPLKYWDYSCCPHRFLSRLFLKR